MAEALAYFRGRTVPLSEAKVSIMTHALHYGTAVFEGVRGNWNQDQGKMFGILELGPISVGTRPTNPCIYVKFSASNHQLLASLPIRNEVRDGNHFEGMFRRELNEIG